LPTMAKSLYSAGVGMAAARPLERSRLWAYDASV